MGPANEENGISVVVNEEVLMLAGPISPNGILGSVV